MKFRKLRIAWSVGCGIACLLLIALWVRSCWVVDALTIPVSTRHFIGVESVPGAVAIAWGDGNRTWETIHPPTDVWRNLLGGEVPSSAWFSVKRMDDAVIVSMPSWFSILIFAILAAVPWIRRFTLRTLLIATTLVAVVLGLVVWAAR